ncbi:MAG: deoxyribodipyrimidine photo-lyase [Rhodobacterales bacterium]|nr:deoxyribodipyrimidine photo-lyase [Rhodobacterales bacterium]
MNVLVWFKRDLRLHDHPALTLAAGMGPVLPVYLVEPDLWAGPEASARQWEFVAESLEDLRDALAAIGAPLVVRMGDAVEVLSGLCRRYNIGRIVSHADSGTAWTRASTLRLSDWARGAGIGWTEIPQPVAAGGGAASVPPSLPVPVLRAVEGVEPGLIPTARALRLAADPCPHRQLGGRARGLELMESFLSHRGEVYRTADTSPLLAERASSRLSPHLAWGTLSLHEVTGATAARLAERPGGRWGGAMTNFQASLAARMDADLAHRPDTAGSDPTVTHHLRDHDSARLAAWAAGETGLPFLDASMRYLRATGWLTARMRAMVTSVATHQLGLDWQASGSHLARMFTDFDPGLFWPQLRLVAGEAGNLPVLWNPVKEGLGKDPTGAFTRRWLPELAAVPDSFLHQPWLWPGARGLLGQRYPEPIVNPAAAVLAARHRIGQDRRNAGGAEGISRRNRPPASQSQLSLPF